MRYMKCSNYLAQRQFAAQQATAQMAQRRGHTGFLGFLHSLLRGRKATRLQQAKIFSYTTEAQHFARGAEGEQALLSRLGATLDDQYLLLHSYPSPKRRGDIDFLLIGPHGITAYEVKSWGGTYWASDMHWFRLDKRTGQWQPSPYGNPSAQILRNAEDVRGLLHQKGFSLIPVYPVIVLGSPYMRVDQGQPTSVPLVHLFRRPPTTQELLGHGGVANALSPGVAPALEVAFLGALP